MNNRSRLINLLVFFICIVLSIPAVGQTVIINEILSSNATINKDVEGDYSDWIEIYNTGDEAVNLKGYALSDDPSVLQKWQFPQLTILPEEHVLVWASGKDYRPDENTISNGLVRKVFNGIQGGQISYLINNNDYPNTPSYEVPLTGYFEVSGDEGDEYAQRIEGHILPPVTGEYTFWISGDDICQLFLSTTESAEEAVKIAESPSYTGVREWNKHSSQQSAKIHLEGGKYYYIYALMKEVVATEHLSVRWQLPDQTIEEPIPDTRLFVIENELHTNFKIKRSGEALFLTDPSGAMIDSTTAVDLPADYSYGSYPDGSSNREVFYLPSPQVDNNDKVFTGWCEDPEVSINSGFFSSAFQVSMTCSTPGAKIHYTTDCSVPTQNSPEYSGSFNVNRTQTVRVRAFAENLQPSKTLTRNYFLNENYTFPVVSITTDPYNLYDQDHGIFIQTHPYWESNLFQDWERPVHVQLFEADRTKIFEIDAGLKVHGGLTRGQEIKSLAIMARSIYGESKINYKLFDDKDIESYNNVLFRNGGNDCAYAIIRDAYMHAIVRGEMDLDLSSSRPVIIYLNGRYWGIHNMREKLNEHFVACNYNISPEKVELLEYSHHNTNVIALEGDASDFNELIESVKVNDLINEQNYEAIRTKIDIPNFIEYQIAQVYFDNGDWPGNNIKWWRENSIPSKWRWLMFDTDFGYSLSPFGNEQGDESLHYKHNTLALAMRSDGEAWPNPPHSTFLFRSLLRNESFKHQFINTFCDHLNSTFKAERVTGILDEFKQLYEPEIGKHRQYFMGRVNWQDEIGRMHTFGELRPNYLYPHLMTQLSLTRNKTITLDTNDPAMGDVGVNTLTCSEYPWRGEYFPFVPIELRALPKEGFRFVSWSDGNEFQERTIDVGETQALTAHFEKISTDSRFVSDANESRIQVYPNPFKDYCTISYDVVADVDVTIQIIDMSGQLIQTLVQEIHSPGSYECVWNGAGMSGKLVNGNVYVCQILTSGGIESKKIIKW